jgi:hypothetical protein
VTTESVNVRLERALAQRLRVHARRWDVSLSLLIALAAELYLSDIETRANHAPVRVRFRSRRGPLSTLERRASADVMASLRRRGGRPL